MLRFLLPSNQWEIQLQNSNLRFCFLVSLLIEFSQPLPEIKKNYACWCFILVWGGQGRRALRTWSKRWSKAKQIWVGYDMYHHHQQATKSLQLDFPGGPAVQKLPANAGDMSSVPGLGSRIPHAGGGTKPMYRNYWACTLELRLCNERSHHSEKPVHSNERKPMHNNEDPVQPKINKLIIKNK